MMTEVEWLLYFFQMYHTNTVYTFEPTPVWCLHFQFTEPHLITLPVIVQFDIVQSKWSEINS